MSNLGCDALAPTQVFKVWLTVVLSFSSGCYRAEELNAGELHGGRSGSSLAAVRSVCVCVWDALMQTLRKVNTEMSSEIVVARCWKEIMFLLTSVQPCFVYIVTISIRNPKSKAWSVIHAVFFFSLHARLFACMWRTSDRTAPTLAHTLQNSSFCRWGTTIAWVIYGRYFHLVQSLKRMVTGR